MGGGSIHKLAPALPGRNVALSPLGPRRSTAGTVAPDTYSTRSSGRWLAWFSRGGLGGRGRLCVFQNRLYASPTSPWSVQMTWHYVEYACHLPGLTLDDDGPQKRQSVLRRLSQCSQPLQPFRGGYTSWWTRPSSLRAEPNGTQCDMETILDTHDTHDTS